MKDGTHVFWLRDKWRRPVSLVAVNKEGNTIKYAVATHNPKDKFNRATGHNKALGRLASLKHAPASFTLPEHVEVNIKALLLYKILNNTTCGVSARRLAAAELGINFETWRKVATSAPSKVDGAVEKLM